jgi:hypothetical protein
MYGQKNESMILSAKPSVLIRRGEQGIDFGASEKFDQGARKPLAGNGQYTLDLCGMRRRLEGRKTKEGTQRREAPITAADADALVLLKMVEKGCDQRRINLLKA